MIAETTAYRLLSNDKTLNELFDKFRCKSFGNGFEQGIFTDDIPETTTNLKKAELAPFMRINNTLDGPVNYADDTTRQVGALIILMTEQSISKVEILKRRR